MKDEFVISAAVLLILVVIPLAISSLIEQGEIGMTTDASAQARAFEIAVLYDNEPMRTGLKTAWGFACLIRSAQETILFDTGSDGAVLLHNMAALGISPNSIDAIVLSHQHWDHVGGLFALLNALDHRVNVYVPASFSVHFKQDLQRYDVELINVLDAVDIAERIYSTGDLAGSVREQALALDTPRGLIIITGCAHPGILNIIETARAILSKDALLVAGGFHLMNDADAAIDGVIARFRDLGVQRVAPTHCSGERARQRFAQAYGANFLAIGVGSVIRSEDL